MTTKLAWQSLAAIIAGERHMTENPAARTTAGGHLLLRPNEDGWALFTPQGELVFRARGLDARRRSLEAAYERGALTVLS